MQMEMPNSETVFIDEQDADLFDMRWYVHYDWDGKHPYIVRNSLAREGLGKTIRMHRVILSRIIGRELERHELVDHIDRNTLNNTRSNLRMASPKDNSRNREHLSGKSSKYKGVSWHAHRKRWQANVGANYSMKYLGLFESEEEAARAYDAKAKELHGDFASLNFPEGA